MDYKEYDAILNVALINLFTLSKEKQVIELNNFDINNRSHLCLLNVAKIAQDTFNFQVTIHCSVLNYWKLKRKMKFHKWFKFNFKSNGINCDKFIEDIENANDAAGIFIDIFEQYYKGVIRV